MVPFWSQWGSECSLRSRWLFCSQSLPCLPGASTWKVQNSQRPVVLVTWPSVTHTGSIDGKAVEGRLSQALLFAVAIIDSRQGRPDLC